MRRWICLTLVVVMSAVLLRAQENQPPKVREDAFLIQKEISTLRTDQAGAGQVPIYSCQALRIAPKWFLTAAHCVYSACRAPFPCTVEIALAEGELRQAVRVNHTTAQRRVFIYDGFFPGQNRISSVDVALIKFDPSSAEYAYAVWKDDEWVSINQKQFEKALPDSPETKAQLQASHVRLVGAANLPTARLLPSIVVPRMTQGKLSYLISPSTDVYFVRELQHFISPGFGVRRGNSGGGVFTARGDLVGLVSSLLYSPDGSASFQNEEGKTLLTLQNADDYFLFTGFNGSTLNFIRNHVSGLRTIGAENGFIKPTDRQFEQIIKTLNKTSMALE